MQLGGVACGNIFYDEEKKMMSSNFGCVGFKVPTVHPSAVPKRPSPMQA
jgi:hypothetical protein